VPNKEKISAEKKVQIVREYLSNRIGIAEAARRVGADEETVKGWVNRYENEGTSGFIDKENRTYSPELKATAVIDYQRGGGSLQTICRKYGIRDKHILRRWIKVYNAHGDFDSVKYSGGGSYMRKARSTTQEERLQIVKECLESGKNYGEMAFKYNVSYQQVRTWTLKFEELGEAGLEDRRGKRKKDQEPRTELEAAQIEIERLKHELYLANMENHLLKKLDEIVRRDASDK
jgi:transposase-like protein